MEDVQLAFPEEFPQEATKLPDVGVLAEVPVEAPAPEQAPKQPPAAPAAPAAVRVGPFMVPPAAPTPVTPTAPSDPDVFTDEGLQVLYKGRKDVPYGRSATASAQPFQGLVIHHTGIDDMDRSVQYGQTVDAARGGSFGYHFYIGKDGSIVQGAPLSARTNHIKDPADAFRRAAKGLSNSNAVGISLIGMGGDHTPAQIDAAEKLAKSLQKRFGLKPDAVYGHGELQSDRQSREGMDVVSRLRPATVDLASRIEPRLNTAIMAAATSAGIPIDYLRVTALIESSGGYDKRVSSSGARGPFQFLPAAWQEHGMGGNPEDPVAAARAAASFAKANSIGLRSVLGRDPTSQELYLAHQQGLGGASALLQNPTKRAVEVVDPKAVTANGGSPDMTAADFVRHIAGKYNERAGVRDPFSPISPADISRPPRINVAPGWTAASLEAQRAGHKQQAATFADLFKDSYDQTTSMGRLGNLAPHFTPTPGWMASKEDLQAIPKQHLSDFEGVSSQAEFDFLRSRLKQRDDLNQRIADAGVKGVGAALLAGLADPVPWIAGAGFGALADGAVQMARLSGPLSRVASAAAGGAGNVAADWVSAEASGTPLNASEALFSFALGAGIGATLGHIGNNPALRQESQQILAAAENTKRELLSGTTAGRPQGVGAALSGNPYPAMSLDEGFAAIAPGSVPEAGLATARRMNPLMGEGARAATSPSDAVRAAGAILGSDVVGKARGADGIVQLNSQAADQEQRRLFSVKQSQWSRTIQPAYDDWAKSQGHNRLQRAIRKDWDEFNEQVYLYVVERDKALADAFPEPVKRAGTTARQVFAELLEDQRNPGREAGMTMRPVVGAENIVTDAHYAPRSWDAGKIDEAVHQHGYVQVTRVVAASVKKAQPAIDDDLADLLGEAIVKNKLTRMYGMDERLGRLMSTPDREIIKDFIATAPGVQATDEQIERLIKQLTPKVTDGVKDARMMRRIDLDETHYVDLPTGRLGIRNLINTNMDDLLTRYNRQASGSVALARTRYQDPKTGQVLIDGIASDADFEAMLRNVQKWEMENRANLPAERTAQDLAREIEGLRWMYDRIKGRPDPAALGKPAQLLRVVRNWNTARLMGGVGFAQLMDFGRPAGSAGIKAMLKQMPGLKKIRDMDGRMVLQHGLDREVEAMFGASSDHLMAPTRRLIEDNVDRATARTGINRAENISGAAADVTMEVSGFHYINQTLKNWNYRLLLQRFSDMADEASRDKSSKNLVRFAGLSDEMTDRVLEQFRKHRSTKEGTITGAQLTQLNINDWDDLEAAVALKRGLYKVANNIVQENDVGGLHKYMSHPLAQTMLQFRMFNVYAYENMLLHGIHNFDGRQFAMASSALFTGALVYMLQTQLQAVGRSDRDQFLEEKMGDPGKVALAALGRSGWTAVLPMFADTAALGLGLDPIFGNARASGQPSDGIFGNPTVGLFNDSLNATKSISNAVFGGGELSQQDARALARTLAWQNLLGITQAYSLMISPLPEK